MLSADSDFYPAVIVASIGRERGFSEERVAEALEKLKGTLSRPEVRLDGRGYLAGDGASRWPKWRTPATSSDCYSSRRRAPYRSRTTRASLPGRRGRGRR